VDSSYIIFTHVGKIGSLGLIFGSDIEQMLKMKKEENKSGVNNISW
jgi:hypothetical protein